MSNNELQDNELMDLYILSEMAYIDTFKDKVESEDELFPDGWYGINNYQKKIEALGEALEKDILVVYTDNYANMIEGVKSL